MKKVLLSFFAFAVFPLFAQQSAHEQFVSPAEAFIGDTVQVKYYFQTGADLIEVDSLELTVEFDAFKTFSDLCFVKKATLRRTGSDYTLFMDVIPWHVGEINIPPFDIASLVNSSLKDSESATGTYIVDIDPIYIKSIVQHTGKNQLQPPQGPMTVPGTTAFLIVAVIFALILFVALLVVLFKIPVIREWLEKVFAERSAKKNVRDTNKSLKKLLKKSPKIEDDKYFAASIQKILRNYCEKRFACNFESLTTDEIAPVILEIAGGEFSPVQDKGVSLMYEIFRRCDFVRFASTLNLKLFNAGEREVMVQKALDLVEIFETEEEEETDADL